MRAPLDTDVAIETPEHIVFHYRVAGPARRAVAYLLDMVICYGVIAIVGLLLALAIVGTAVVKGELPSLAGAAGGLLLVLVFAAQWVYFVVWEGAVGRSPGKMALGLRVVSTSGRPIGFRAAALRNLLRAADALPTAYLLGVAWMALSSRFQRLGDTVAGTIVVVPERTRGVRPIELAPPATPSELATLPEEVTLDADERAAIELFLRRQATLGRERATELAAVIAEPLGARIGYRHADPTRLLALVYDRAVSEGRSEAPPSSFRPNLGKAS